MKSKNKIILFTGIIVLGLGLLWFFVDSQPKTPISSTSSSQQHVAIHKSAPEAVFTNLKGSQVTLSSFKGKKVMLWLVATWCSSCSEGAKILSQNKDRLKDITIITLKTYGNAGYPGPSIKEFISKIAPSMLLSKNRYFGDITLQSAKVYNPRNYPDIYFLIDKDGVVREINDAPAATIGDILKFAQS